MCQIALQQVRPDSVSRSIVKAKILVVDDEGPMRRLLKRILETDGYACETAENADSAMACIIRQKFDLVISDVHMPGETGIELVEKIKKIYPNIPALMISALQDEQTTESAISIGASDYLVKPFQKGQVLISVKNALRRRSMELQDRFEKENMEKIIDSQVNDLKLTRGKLKKTLDGVVKAMALAIESRDPYTAGHQQRVGHLCAAIGNEMGIPAEQIYWLKMAGMVHDIGKISVPAEILCKPTRLTEPEFSIIKEHPATGYHILKEIDFPYPIAEIIYQHHERLNGSGYPRGLKDGEILVEARILAVADVVEAMASHRPYRASLGIEAALAAISQTEDTLYDPYVVEACCLLFKKKGFKL